MEKSGWEKFVRDNALGDQEFITFTHKGKMCFTVNIFNKNGTEMIQPPQSRAFFASSSRVKTEQDVKTEEVVLSSELSQRVPTRAAESEKKKIDEEHQSLRTRRTKYVVNAWRIFEGASSSSVADTSIYITKSYLLGLAISRSFADDHMPKEKTMIVVHHPNGKKSWNEVYCEKTTKDFLCWIAKIKQGISSFHWGHLHFYICQTKGAASPRLETLRGDDKGFEVVLEYKQLLLSSKYVCVRQ